MASIGFRLYLILLILVIQLTPCMAQINSRITPDGSLGTNVTSDGTSHTIAGGTIHGSNLFHSFDRFDVGTGDTAHFIGPGHIDHILSRVTGGSRSMIDGTIHSEIPGADLFLLNPSGVLFGPHAFLVVQGSFHVSTADVVQFSDGGRLVADRSAESILSVANPVAFGFLKDNPQGIRIDGSDLRVPTGQTLSIIGGDIDMNGRVVEVGNLSRGGLSARDGQILITSVTSRGEVALSSNGLRSSHEMENAVTNGAITLSDVRLTVSGQGSGMIRIRGGNILLEDNSHLTANAGGREPGVPGGITIDATDTVTLIEHSSIQSIAGTNNTGNITVTARNIVLGEGSSISNLTAFRSGDAGNITIRASDIILVTDNSQIVARSAVSASGSTGDILMPPVMRAVSRYASAIPSRSPVAILLVALAESM